MGMGQTKAYSDKEFKRILRANGFVFDRCTGDHMIYKRGSEMAIVSRPMSKMIARRLIKELNLKDY